MASSALDGAASPRAARFSAAAWADPVLVFAALYAAFAATGPRMLGDPDSHWHVAVGRAVWANGSVPWTDAYSHTFAGAPWIAKEWLSQLLLFAAHAAAGWAGTVILAAAAAALAFALLFRWLAARLRIEAALALTGLSVVFCAPHILARPLVFAFLTLFGWMRLLVDAVEEDGRTPPWPALLVLVLWANLHGSFTIAYPLAAFLAAEAVVRTGPGLRAAVAARWAGFLALAVAAGCVSPYGIHALLVTVTIFGSGESLPFVQEWQPLSLDTVGVGALASAALAAGLLAADWRRNLFRLLALAMVTAMTVRHARFLDVYAFVVPLLAAGPLARRLRALHPGPRPSEGPARWPALAPIIIVATAFVLIRPPQPSAAVTPAAALEAARRLALSGPVYNDYDFGGFLMAEGVPTFIDGRTDQLFLGGFISSLYRAVRAPDGADFMALLARRGVRWAMVRPGSAESRHLDRAPGWSRLHADPTAVLYGRL